MIKIIMHNMQAIGDAEITFENNSITEFTGPNSNGKSILGKLIQYSVSGDIYHKETRLSLIKKHCDSGYTTFFWDNKAINILLHLERSKSCITYIESVNGEERKITRCLNEGGWKELLYEFGFRFYADGDVCLQLSPTFGSIPFITTGGAVNEEIVKDITTDKTAENFMSLFQTITYPLFKEKINACEATAANLQQIVDNMESYDYEAYENIQHRLEDVYRCIQGYNPFRFTWIPIPGNLDLVNYKPFRFKNIPIYELGCPAPRFNYSTSGIAELASVLRGVCPTCGHTLTECVE